MKYKNIIVTGGAGFIGSNFVRYIKNENIKITILDKITYASTEETIKDLLDDNVKFYKVDISNKEELNKYITKDNDLIVHFAAESFNDNSLKNTRDFINSNIIGTYNLIELACLYNIRFHHISTGEVYGDFSLKSNEKFTEKTQYNPSSPYSSTKASADLLVKAWVRSFNLQATISNCSNNYGPYQNPEKFIPRQISNILKGKKPELYGNGENIRDWIYVLDHCKAIDLIIDKGVIGETYLIGVDNERSNKEVLFKILKNMNKPNDYYEFIKDRPGHDLRYGINASKLIETLNFKPDYTDFDLALKETIKWYVNNKNWIEILEKKKEK